MARAGESSSEYSYLPYTQNSDSFTNSPLYKAESWERAGEFGLGCSTEKHLYPSSPRITRQQSGSKGLYSCPDCTCCSDSCISLSQRIREKCAVWRLLCCINCRREGCQLKLMYRQYFFFSKSLVLVLILNALYSTAVFGVTTEVLKVIVGPEYLLLRTLLIHGVTQLMFPVAGHLADLYVGRHNIIQFSLWIAWLGLALLGLAFAFDGSGGKLHTLTQYLAFPVTAVLLSISYVCFMSNIIPFGLDQLQGASHIHFSSFFYWWYWTLNIGIVNIPQYCKQNVEIDVLIQAEIGLVCITLALILDILLKDWFVLEPISKKGNPFLQIVTVLKDACRVSKNRTQQIPSVVFHEVNMRKFGCMERIKKRYGGKYETEDVENVKTFFRILMVLGGVGFSTLIYAGVFDTIGLMVANMSGTLASVAINTSLCEVDISFLNVANALVLVVLIPLLDLLIVPMLRHAFINPSIMCRLVFGSVLAFISSLSIFLIHMEGVDSDYMICIFHPNVSPLKMELSVYWILLPTLVLTIAEIFIYIPGFEFICAQAPYNMRGLLIGVFFSIQGIFSLVSVFMQYLFMRSQAPFSTLSCGEVFYLTLMLIAVVGLLINLVVCSKYKRRKRDEVINNVTLIEEHFSSYLNRRENQST